MFLFFTDEGLYASTPDRSKSALHDHTSHLHQLEAFERSIAA